MSQYQWLYKNEDYDLELHPNSKAGKTWGVVVAELVPAICLRVIGGIAEVTATSSRSKTIRARAGPIGTGAVLARCGGASFAGLQSDALKTFQNLHRLSDRADFVMNVELNDFVSRTIPSVGDIDIDFRGT